MSLSELAIAVIVGAGALGGAYWQGRQDGRDQCQAQDARDEKVARIAGAAAAASSAEAISRIKVQRTTINSEVQREVSERVVYRDCGHSPEQLQRINAALTGIQSEPAGRGLVPPADAAGGPELRRDDAQADRGGRPVP